jgi:hypothetical protein
VAHELGPRRKLARHRGAVFMGPAALPRWPLALCFSLVPGVGESVASRPDNAAYAKLRSSSARLALPALPCACGRASRTHPLARKARAGRSFKHCRHCGRRPEPPLPCPGRGVHRPALIGSPTPTAPSCCPCSRPPARRRPHNGHAPGGAVMRRAHRRGFQRAARRPTPRSSTQAPPSRPSPLCVTLLWSQGDPGRRPASSSAGALGIPAYPVVLLLLEARVTVANKSSSFKAGRDPQSRIRAD